MDDIQKKRETPNIAFVLGIISIVLFFTGIIGAMIGIITMFLAIRTMRRINVETGTQESSSFGKSKVALIMGIVGVILGIAWWSVLSFLYQNHEKNLSDQDRTIENREVEELMNDF